MSVKVEVWGRYALFSRPELSVERVSYDVMTPSAARGILESIYWHPGMGWVIDRIHVLSPIKFANVRRNEVSEKISASNVRSVMNGGGASGFYVNTKEKIQQRASMVLKDVHYVIEAHFEIMRGKAAPTDNEGKFISIINRRLQKGQCYSRPYFGCREFPADFRAYEGTEIRTAYHDGDRDLGFMLYDMDYSDPHDIKPTFFKGVLHNGTLDLSDCRVFK